MYIQSPLLSVLLGLTLTAVQASAEDVATATTLTTRFYIRDVSISKSWTEPLSETTYNPEDLETIYHTTITTSTHPKQTWPGCVPDTPGYTRCLSQGGGTSPFDDHDDHDSDVFPVDGKATARLNEDKYMDDSSRSVITSSSSATSTPARETISPGSDCSGGTIVSGKCVGNDSGNRNLTRTITSSLGLFSGPLPMETSPPLQCNPGTNTEDLCAED